MAKSASPLSVRMSEDERRLLDTVAVYLGRSVSDFVRQMAVDGAAAIVRDHGGVEKILQVINEQNERMSEEQRRSLEATAHLHSAGPRT